MSNKRPTPERIEEIREACKTPFRYNTIAPDELLAEIDALRAENQKLDGESDYWKVMWDKEFDKANKTEKELDKLKATLTKLRDTELALLEEAYNRDRPDGI